jgi:hypothetical protein
MKKRRGAQRKIGKEHNRERGEQMRDKGRN